MVIASESLKAIDLIFRLPFCPMHFFKREQIIPPLAHLTVTHKTDFWFYLEIQEDCTLHIILHNTYLR